MCPFHSNVEIDRFVLSIRCCSIGVSLWRILSQTMKYNQFTIKAEVWLYPGMAGWHFITIPTDVSEEINDRFGDKKRGWGSLPVEVTVGTTTWKTSIFPDTKAHTYLLPIKSDVRKKEGIETNTSVTLLLEIRV